MKKTISLLLSVFMLVAVIPATSMSPTANAADLGYLDFTLNDDLKSYSVFRCDSSANGTLVIPSIYNDLAVTGIWPAAFSQCNNLTSITIPDSVTSIDMGAFMNCTSLKSISIPNGVKSIESATFFGCTSLNSITIPDSVTSIGGTAFYGCSLLCSVKIPDSVLSVGDSAFMYCTSLKSVELSNNLTHIGDHAFYSCNRLTAITIPDTVLSIGANAFEHCTSLKSVKLSNNLTHIGDEAFYYCNTLTGSIIIPESVVSIGNGVFSGCTKISSISVSSNNNYYLSTDGVLFNKDKTILIQYPSGKSNTSYTIPDNVKKIESLSFNYATKLVSVSIPNTVESIGDSAFYYCKNLASVTIPHSVKSIGESSFADCYALSSIDVSKDNNCYASIDGVLFSKDKTNLIQFPLGKVPTSYTIPTKVTHIGDRAFMNCQSLKIVKIPGGVTDIGYGSFYGCLKLTEISMTNSVLKIGDRAFYDCIALNKVKYSGRKSEWSTITIGNNNDYLLLADITCNDGKIATSTEDIISGKTLFKFYNKSLVIDSTLGDGWSSVNNVIATYNGVGEQYTNSYKYLDMTSLSTGITFDAAGYQTYIVPAYVASSWQLDRKATHDVWLAKDKKNGKPYVSTVFARIVAEEEQPFEEVTTQTVNVLLDEKYDVVISTGPLNGEIPKEYFLSQGEGHKISNSVGQFLSQDLFSVFDRGKPVYAYVAFESGLQTEPVQVKLERKEHFTDVLNETEFNFLGESGFKVSVPDDIPILGGSELDAGFQKLPVGFQVTGDKIRVSVGIDIFSHEFVGEGKVKDTWNWFVGNCKSMNCILEDADDKVNTFKQLMAVKQKKFGGLEDYYVEKKEPWTLNGGILGYAEGYITQDGFVWTEYSGSVVLEIIAKIKHQFLVAGIAPFYAYVEGGADGSFEFTGSIPIPDKNLEKIVNGQVKVTPKIKIGGGVGVDDAIAAGFYGKSELPLLYNKTENHLVVDLTGELGLEAEFFFISANKKLFEGTLNLIDEYYGVTKSSTKTLSRNISEFMNPEYSNSTKTSSNVKLLSRDYADDTSNWLGDIYYPKQHLSSIFGIIQDVTVKELQTSVYKNSQLQLVEFNDTMMMAWIEDSEERDDYNRFRLVYSVYNPIFDTWSDPVAVDDNGRNDSAPSLATDGENVYIAWQNLNETFTTVDDTTTEKILQSTEIKTARYNSETGLFDSVKTLTDNATYDYAPTIAVNDGVATICWVNSTTTDFESGTLSVLRNDFSDTNIVVAENLNYITSLETNGNDISYSMDIDGDLTTDDVYTFTNNIQQTGLEEESLSTPEITYGLVDNESVLFFVDNCNIHYMKQGVVYDVFKNRRAVGGNINVVSNDGVTILSWTESTDVGTELFTSNYENGEWSEPIQLTELNAIISNIDLVSYNGSLYGTFNRTNLTEETDVDGDTVYTKGSTDICLLTSNGFIDVEVSNVFVDEKTFVKGEIATVSVAVTNNGTETIESMDFNISDGLRTNSDITKNISIESGATEIIELSYSVPEDLSKTELTVSATVESDSDDKNNSGSLVVGLTDVSVSDMDIEKVGSTYVITGLVNNQNCIDAENVDVRIVLSDLNEELSTVEIGTIAAKESKEVQFCVNEDVVDVTTEPKTLKFIAETTSKETLITNNEGTVAILHDEVDGCEHIYEEWTVIKEATCTETGIQSSICAICGIPNTEIIDYAHNHESEWIMDDVKHWKVCANGCGTILDEGLHNYEFVECCCGKIEINEDSSTLITIEDETTILEKDKNLIITDNYLLDNVYEIVTLDSYYEFRITHSHDFYDCILLGTGSKVDIYYDDYLIDSYTLVVRGDVNGDSVCDSLDLMLIELARHESNNVTLEGAYFTAANLAEDSEINIDDFNAVVNKAIA